MTNRNVMYSCISVFLLLFSTLMSANSLTLEKKAQYIIEETQKTIINYIDNVDFSPDNKLFLTSSIYDDKIVLFKTQNNKIYKELTPDFSLADSVYAKGKYFRKEYELMKPQEVTDIIGHDYKHSYRYAEFINDSIVFIMARVNGVSKKKGIDIYSQSGIRIAFFPCIILYNIIDDTYTCDMLQNREELNNEAQFYFSSFIQPVKAKFSKNNKKIYSYIQTPYQYQDSLIDNLISISANNLDGQFDKIVHYLPEEFTRTGLKYNLIITPCYALGLDDNIFVTYPHIEKVYNLTQGTSFDLEKLPGTNKTLWDKIENLDDKNRRSRNYMDSLLNSEISIFTKEIFSTKDTRLITHVNYSRKEQTDSVLISVYLQLYTSDGKLLATNDKIPYYSEDGSLEYLHYSKNDNLIRVFRKNKKNWIVEIYEWKLT